MPKLNLGRVVGRDGGFGNTDTVYINDGGAPSVTVEASGEDTAKDFVFTFKNLVRDVATADEVEQIAAGEIVQSSNVITAGVMSSIWAKIKGAFATKSHTHDASDITAGELAAILIANGLIDTDMLAAGAVTTAKIADGAVTNAKLDQTLRDSLSHPTRSVPVDISSALNYFVVAPEVNGFRPISATFDGSWSSGRPVIGCPMANNGGYGSRIGSVDSDKLTLNGVVVFTYAHI